MERPGQKTTIYAEDVKFRQDGNLAIATGNVLIAQDLSDRLGQTIVVDNRPGAMTQIGADALNRAPPDGYTLMIVTSEATMLPFLKKSYRYDPVKDFTPIALLATSWTVFAVNPKHPARTLAEFVRSGKSFVFGTAGTGSGAHITAEYFFKVLAKVEAVHTPYQSGAQAATALLGGQIDYTCSVITDVSPHIRAGSLKGFGVVADERNAALPDVPTTKEAGLPEFKDLPWIGLFAPKNTPREILDTLSDALDQALDDPEVQKRFFDLGGVVPDKSKRGQQALGALVKSEIVRWGPIIKAAGIKSE